MRKPVQQNSYWPSVIAEFKLEKMAHGKSQCKGWPNIWFVRKQAKPVCEQSYKIVGDIWILNHLFCHVISSMLMSWDQRLALL